MPDFTNISMAGNRSGSLAIPVPDHITRGYNGSPNINLQRADLTNTSIWTAFDPNSKLNSAITDGGEGTGITIALTGGLTAVTDPFDGAYWITPAYNLFGQSLGSTINHFFFCVEVLERTAPSQTSDFNVVIGLCNESSDSSTIDSLMRGVRFGSSSRIPTAVSVSNGVSTYNNGTTGGGRIQHAVISKVGLGSSANLASTIAGSMTVTLATNNISNSNASCKVANFGDNACYVVVSAFRSSTAAGTATGKFDFYYGCGLPVRIAGSN